MGFYAIINIVILYESLSLFDIDRKLFVDRTLSMIEDYFNLNMEFIMKKSYCGLILEHGHTSYDWKKYTIKDRIFQCILGFIGNNLSSDMFKKEKILKITLIDLTGYDHIWLSCGGWSGSYKNKEKGAIPLDKFSEYKVTLPKLRKNGNPLSNTYLEKLKNNIT